MKISKNNKNNPKKNKNSKELIKNEKLKLKEEKKRLKEEKEKIKKEKKKLNNQKFSQTKLGNILKRIFFIKEEQESQSLTIKNQVLSMLYFELVGALLCLIVLFILSGGKNYFKLYKELNKLIDTYDTITSNYYGDIDKNKLIDNAISSMIASIDDNFTNYSDESTTTTFMENVNGTYEGIGATVTTDKDGNIVVVEVFEDSPSQEAGLKGKDIILKIDGKDYTKKDSTAAAKYIKENPKHKITLTILRDNQEKEITITRKKIEIPTVSSKIIEQDGKKIGYINLSIFTSISTQQFEKKLKYLEKEKIDGLIIDVRNNSGGYLSTATNIASLFLKKGQVIYQLSDKNGTTKAKDETKEKRTYPIAIIINKSSASASEILASAIKESYGGHVVGTNSYGKGTVQKTKKLSDGSMIKYTIQKWLTPKGNWINEKGVTPTDYIELDPSKEDTQLTKAISILIKDLN